MKIYKKLQPAISIPFCLCVLLRLLLLWLNFPLLVIIPVLFLPCLLTLFGYLVLPLSLLGSEVSYTCVAVPLSVSHMWYDVIQLYC
jgi:hypothetical protein